MQERRNLQAMWDFLEENHFQGKHVFRRQRIRF